MRNAISAALAGVSLVSSCGAVSGQDVDTTDREWVSLFDGYTLEQWTPTGDKLAWVVESGEFYPRGGGGWLQTNKYYRDFELELEFKLPESGNSGVGIRGSRVDDPAFSGMEVQIYDTFGQEPGVGTCGAVYGAIAPRVNAVKPVGEWNNYRIRMVGNELTVTLNDEVIHENEPLDGRGYRHIKNRPWPLESRLTTGRISLQDHGDRVRFRNVRVKDLSPDPDPGGWEPIFNGTDLTGWHSRGSGKWDVSGGTIVGRDGPGHLYTDEEFENVEMRAFVRINTDGNSGFYPRAVPPEENPDSWPNGYEAQVDNHDPKNFTGSIYARAWPQFLLTRDNAWFDYRVRIEGHHLQTWINGNLMVDEAFDPAETGVPSKGHIVLQTHHKGNVVWYRDIQVRRLD